MRKYYVYLLRCFDGSFYAGVTNDVDRRFYEHSFGDKKDSYTYSRRPLILVFVGEFERAIDAIDFEKKLKSWTHAKKRVFAEKCAVGGVAVADW